VLLPTLPNRLAELECAGNQLTVIQELPQTLKKLDCRVNRLRWIPKPPVGSWSIRCEGNPWCMRLAGHMALSPGDERKAMNAYHKELRKIKAAARRILYVKLALVDHNIQTTGINRLPSDVLTLVCSFMSGFDGSIAMQLRQMDHSQYE